MRLLPVALASLLVLVHAELWFGKGGVPHRMMLQSELAQQLAANAQARAVYGGASIPEIVKVLKLE